MHHACGMIQPYTIPTSLPCPSNSSETISMEPMPPIMAATTEEVRVQTENMSLRSGENIEQVVTPSQTFGAELRYKRKTLSIKDLESEVIRVALCTLKFDMYDKFVKANTEFTSGRMAPDEFLAQCKELFKHYPVLFEPLRKHVSKYAAGPR